MVALAMPTLEAVLMAALSVFVGANKLTPRIIPDFHEELAMQMERFADAPWGFLGLSGDQLMAAVGAAECALGALSLVAPRNVRLVCYGLLATIFAAAIFTHLVNKDNSYPPAVVMFLAAVACMVQVSKEGTQPPPDETKDAKAAKKAK